MIINIQFKFNIYHTITPFINKKHLSKTYNLLIVHDVFAVYMILTIVTKKLFKNISLKFIWAFSFW